MKITTHRGHVAGPRARGGAGRLVGALGAMLLLLTLLAPAAVRPAAAQRDDRAALDLAALTLLPSDLPSADYLLGNSYAVTILDQASAAANYRDGGNRERAAFLDALQDAGYRQGYSSSLYLPTAPGSIEADVLVVSYVFAYADAAGAAAGFALLEDESDVPSAQDLPDPPDLGDEAEVTRDRGETSEGDPFRALDLTFRVDHLVAGVALYDYAGGAPRRTELAPLSETLAQRVEDFLAGTATGEPRGHGLGATALRFADGPDVSFPFAYEAYQRLDGETVPLVGQSASDMASLAEFYGEATDVYAVQFEIELDGLDAEVNPYYSAELYRFDDEDAAAAWMADQVAGWEAGPGGYETIAPVADAAPLGDESTTFAYEYLDGNGDPVRGHLIYARVGTVVASLRLDARPEPSLAAAEEIAALQVACLVRGACPVGVPVPRSLAAQAEPVGTPEADATPEPQPTADATAEPEETPDPGTDTGVDGNAYVSPSYGWTIEWDEQFWEVEDVQSEDGVDFLQLGDPQINTVRFIAAPEFGGDPETCVDDFVDSLRGDPRIDAIERLRGEDGDIVAGEEEDRVFAAYTYTVTDQNGTFEVSQYVECRVLVPDEAVLAIVYVVRAVFFEEQFPLVEDLLAAVQIPGADGTPEPAATSAANAEPDATPEAAATTATPAAGGTYTSPTFGYRLTYDETWTVREEVTEDGVDRLTLGNGASTVAFLAAAEDAGDAATCLERATAAFESDPAVSDIAPILADGEPVLETGPDRSFTASTYTFTNERGQEVRLARYVECRTLVPGEATLLITHTTLTDLYEDQVEPVATLLEGLELPRGNGLVVTIGTPATNGTPEATDD